MGHRAGYAVMREYTVNTTQPQQKETKPKTKAGTAGYQIGSPPEIDVGPLLAKLTDADLEAISTGSCRVFRTKA